MVTDSQFNVKLEGAKLYKSLYAGVPIVAHTKCIPRLRLPEKTFKVNNRGLSDGSSLAFLWSSAFRLFFDRIFYMVLDQIKFH